LIKDLFGKLHQQSCKDLTIGFEDLFFDILMDLLDLLIFIVLQDHSMTFGLVLFHPLCQVELEGIGLNRDRLRIGQMDSSKH